MAEKLSVEGNNSSIYQCIWKLNFPKYHRKRFISTPSPWVTERNTTSAVQGYTLWWVAGCDDTRAAGQTLPWEEASPQARQAQHHWMVPVPSKSLDNLFSLILDVQEAFILKYYLKFLKFPQFITQALFSSCQRQGRDIERVTRSPMRKYQ